MSPDDLVHAVTSGFWLVVVLLLPFVLVAALSGAAASALAGFVGVHDPTVARVVRVLAVFVVVGLTMATTGDAAVEYARETWAGLGGVAAR